MYQIWGGIFEIKRTGGAWSETEKEYDINEKELLTIFYTLKSFKFDLQSKYIKTFSDNTTEQNGYMQKIMHETKEFSKSGVFVKSFKNIKMQSGC